MHELYKFLLLAISFNITHEAQRDTHSLPYPGPKTWGAAARLLAPRVWSSVRDHRTSELMENMVLKGHKFSNVTYKLTLGKVGLKHRLFHTLDTYGSGMWCTAGSYKAPTNAAENLQRRSNDFTHITCNVQVCLARKLSPVNSGRCAYRDTGADVPTATYQQ